MLGGARLLTGSGSPGSGFFEKGRILEEGAKRSRCILSQMGRSLDVVSM